MERKLLSSALLFLLSVPLVMQYRILPITGTPYWLFGLLFALLLIHSLITIYPAVFGKYADKIRMGAFVTVLLIAFGGVAYTKIVDRHRIAPVWEVHDIILQQEQAIRYFVNGKNPYKETYFGTPVEMFHYDEMGKPAVNPALYHFVMPPFYLLFPLPFYWVANHTFGYFDGRMVLYLLTAGTLIILYKTFADKYLAEIAILLTLMAPATVGYILEGRSDAFALFWLVASLFFLSRRAFVWSAIVFALAVASKQTMWFAVPLFSVYLFSLNKKSVKTLLFPCVAGVFVLFGLFAPFLLWDAQAFLDSVILYLSAGGQTGYPISGYGLSMVLYSMGSITDLHAAYPFLLWQLGFGIPTVLVTMYFFMKKPALSRFFIGFALTLFSFWYTSRYFNNSHVSVIGTLVMLGILFHIDEETRNKKSNKILSS